jgi:hypothetical protein
VLNFEGITEGYGEFFNFNKNGIRRVKGAGYWGVL